MLDNFGLFAKAACVFVVANCVAVVVVIIVIVVVAVDIKEKSILCGHQQHPIKPQNIERAKHTKTQVK